LNVLTGAGGISFKANDPDKLRNFAPSKNPLMIDLRVENLRELLAQLKREGAMLI
jgi:hypothetical protein